MLTAASLDTRIEILTRAPGLDGLGQAQTSLVTVASVYANVRRLGSGDRTAGDQRGSSSSISVVVRAGSAVAAGMVVRWDGRLWDIDGEPLPLDRRWTRFEATSGVGAAASG